LLLAAAATLIRDYDHFTKEMKGLPTTPVEQQIVDARAALASRAANPASRRRSA